MKVPLVFLVMFFCLAAKGQDYYISFGGSGASAFVSSVKVENLRSETAITINGNDILHLTSIMTGVNPDVESQVSGMKIYPNPMQDYSILEIYPPINGDATISVFDMTGKPVFISQAYLENSKQEFRLSGFESGFYLINVRGSSYQFSVKLICSDNNGGSIAVEKLSGNMSGSASEQKIDRKELQATIEMEYNEGDRLKFTGISGNYRTVLMDIPVSDKTVLFNFIPCTDGDLNNYSIVEIGNQIWMAENLKTTKYLDQSPIPNVPDQSIWDGLASPGYCWFSNNVNYKDVYGALYNFYVLDPAGNGGKYVCPSGWHIPTDQQWTELTSYLGDAEAGNKLKESGTSHWKRPNSSATNESGFTALPGGYRAMNLGYMVFGEGGCWWSSTEADPSSSWERGMNISRTDVYRTHVSRDFGFSIRCLKGAVEVKPVLSTKNVTDITPTSSICGGNITSDGGSEITVRGVCWSTSLNPTIDDNKTVGGVGSGEFTSLITGLEPGTVYYVRAYATNGVGTSYGNQVSFSTQ